MTPKLKIDKWFDTQKVLHQRIRFILVELEDLFENLNKDEASKLLEEINNKYKLWNS